MLHRLHAAYMTRRLCAILFLALLFLGGPSVGEVSAQLSADLGQARAQYQSASVYRFAETGDLTVTVNVWGAVRNPGLYEIPEGTHLSTLFSLAGGPAIAERTNRERLTTTLKLIRDGNRENVVFESVMEDEILVLDEDPILREGDVMTAEVLIQQRFSIRDIFPIVAAIASLTLAIDRVMR